jgi:hypothetical protein
VGFEIPTWLASLEQEVLDQTRPAGHAPRPTSSALPFPQHPLTLDEVQQQLTGWERHPH